MRGWGLEAGVGRGRGHSSQRDAPPHWAAPARPLVTGVGEHRPQTTRPWVDYLPLQLESSAHQSSVLSLGPSVCMAVVITGGGVPWGVSDGCATEWLSG